MNPSAWKSNTQQTEECQAGEGYDGKECCGNMGPEGAERARLRVIPVRMFPVAMDKGEDACRDKQQDETESKEKTRLGGPIRRQHEEPVWFEANRIRLPTWERI